MLNTPDKMGTGSGDGAPWDGLEAMKPLEPLEAQPHQPMQPTHQPHRSRLSMGPLGRVSMGSPQPRLTRRADGALMERSKTHAGRIASEHSPRRPSLSLLQRPHLERRHSDPSVFEPETRMATLRHALVRMFRDPATRGQVCK